MMRVLIVDDEQIIRTSMMHSIPWSSIDCTVVGSAQNGMEAYNMICDLYPDIVITDIKMPILDGLQLIERAVALDKNIEFVILSGYGEFRYAQAAMKYGVKYYHLKPTMPEDLMDTVVKIGKEFAIRRRQKEAQRAEFLKDLQYPLQKSIIVEALKHPDEFQKTFQNYLQLFYVPEESITLFVVRFREEAALKAFSTQFVAYLQLHRIARIFVPLYVRNALYFFFQSNDISVANKLREFAREQQYSENGYALRTIEVELQQYASFSRGVYALIGMISRDTEIHLIQNSNAVETVYNPAVDSHHIAALKKDQLSFRNPEEAQETLKEFWSTIHSFETAQVRAMYLILQLSDGKNQFLLSPENLQQLQNCKTMEEIKQWTSYLILNRLYCKETSENEESYVVQLKKYVAHHLDADNLSLKWLAENLLFISVGYLSKLFLRTEGIKFSVFLNQQRIERAKELMLAYNRSNIQDIAMEVGFGNNPRYFGQVFKKYVEMTPTEFMEKNIRGAENRKREE